jgi:N-methylhydantoinase A
VRLSCLSFGLLVADIEHEEVATFIAKTTEVSPKDIARVLNGLREACERKRKGVGISLTKLQIRISAEMRYIGQSYELEVPFPEGEGEIIHDTIRKVTERFHEVHQNVYQHSIPTLPVEFVAFRVVYSQEPALIPKLNKLDANLRKEISPKSRQAYFDEYHGFVDTRVYDRATLAVGQKLAGPAVIEQADTTTVIYPNQVAEVDEWGNLLFKVV